jgi:cytoskeletal protein CcmA (bactofilin family)
MLSSFKGKGPEKDHSPAGNGLGGNGPAGNGPPGFLAAGAQPQRAGLDQSMGRPAPIGRPEPAGRPELMGRPEPATKPDLMSKPAPKPETISSIGAGMSIVGQVVCTGQARIFGRVEGELRVTDLLLGDSSQVEGNVIAQEVTVRGHVKGTIRAVRVRLEDGSTVEGDIFHRSLSIEEGALFEGSSRRVENPTNAPASMPEEIAPERPAQAVALPPAPTLDSDVRAEPSSAMAHSAS